MMRLKQLGLAAALLGFSTLGAPAQMSIEPPTPAATAPSTQPAPPVETTATPTPTPASTAPSAETVMEGLMKDKPTSTIPDAASTTTVTAANTNRTAQPVVTEAAPNTPKSTRIREGEFVWSRVGRLQKDEKTGAWFFAFEADGQQMQDPPMTLIPSRLLAAMEGASSEGTQPTRFKVSGEVTEYGGKNYLWVQHMEILRELNKGIGG